MPALVVLGKIFGINGILYAGPFADGLAFVISVILLIIQVKNLKIVMLLAKLIENDVSINEKLSKNVVITISREYGSGGRYVARLVADKLGIKFYDKDFIKGYLKKQD